MQERTADRHLIGCLKNKEASAVADRERVYWVKIYKLAFRYMRNHEDAEAVTKTSCPAYTTRSIRFMVMPHCRCGPIESRSTLPFRLRCQTFSR